MVGCSIGDELEGGGSPDHEGALRAEEDNGAAPIMRCQLLPPEAAEQAVNRWALAVQSTGRLWRVVSMEGRTWRGLATGGRNGVKEGRRLSTCSQRGQLPEW